jgi:hypothetical protein
VANLIQIKRSATNAIVPSLSPGELAFTQVGNVFFVGAPDGTTGPIPIGGERKPGFLTANQALVANNTSGINRVYVANLEVSFIKTNVGSDPGTSGYVLASGGPSAPVYWQSLGALGVDQAAEYYWTNVHNYAANAVFAGNTYANVVYANSNFYTYGIGSGTGGFLANTTQIVVGNNTINTVITSAGLNVNGFAVIANNLGVFTTGTINSVSHTTGTGYNSPTGGVTVNTTHIAIGNTSVKGFIAANNSTVYFTGVANSTNYIQGNTAQDLNIYADGKAATAYTNATTYAATIAATAYSNAVAAFNTNLATPYTNAMADTLTRNGVYTGNNTFNGTNTVINSNAVFNANSINISNTGANVNIGNNVIISSNLSSWFNGGFEVNHQAAIAIGNPGLNGSGSQAPRYAPQGAERATSSNLYFSNSSLIQVGNSSTYANLVSGTLYLNGGGVSATVNSTVYSGSVSTACNALKLGGIDASNYIQTTYSGDFSGNIVFGNSSGGTNSTFNTNVAFKASIKSDFIPAVTETYSLGNTTNRWKALYVAGNTIYIGNSSISVDSSNSITIGGANAIIVNTATINTVAGTLTTFNSNLTVASNTITFSNTTANIIANYAQLNIRDIVVSNSVIINGTITTIDTNNIIVKDSLIKLADQNSTGDTLDFGFYGQYFNGTSVAYAGIYRQAGSSDTNPLFKLFSSTTEPSTTSGVVTATNLGTLQAYLQPFGAGGAFVINSSSINITANSTVSSAITANSLALSTALAASYGGTGYKTYTTGDTLYASGTTTLAKLSIGTSGYVLQVNSSSLPEWNTLDGGSF